MYIQSYTCILINPRRVRHAAEQRIHDEMRVYAVYETLVCSLFPNVIAHLRTQVAWFENCEISASACGGSNR